MGITAVILAAGKGVRMRSDLPKVLHRVAGRPMIQHVINASREAGADRLVAVVGYGKEEVEEALKGQEVMFAVQAEQLGTGHALMQAEHLIAKGENILVLAGDTPLLTGKTLKALLTHHLANGNQATILSAQVSDPTGYGRIVRQENGELRRIVEHKDASPDEKKIKEINTGVYVFDAEKAFTALKQIKPNNAQDEYYLTDILEIMLNEGFKVEALPIGDEEEIMGVNDRVFLARADKILRRRYCEELMRSGVTIISPETTFVDAGVEVGQDTVIYPFTILEGSTRIGKGCEIGPSVHMTDSEVGDGTVVHSSRLANATVGRECQIGPFAYLRPGTVLKDRVKVGDFVEVKNSLVHEGSKLPHLSYVGDAEVGPRANIGAGTITCNYDGVNKHRTVIGPDAFIGSNTNLVAPVTVGEGAFTGAGSTITRDVPPFALAVERAEQKHIPNWGKKSGKMKTHN